MQLCSARAAPCIKAPLLPHAHRSSATWSTARTTRCWATTAAAGAQRQAASRAASCEGSGRLTEACRHSTGPMRLPRPPMDNAPVQGCCGERACGHLAALCPAWAPQNTVRRGAGACTAATAAGLAALVRGHCTQHLGTTCRWSSLHAAPATCRLLVQQDRGALTSRFQLIHSRCAAHAVQ